MKRHPIYSRELYEMRRFGNRRPTNNVVVITDNWNVARVHREQLGMCALVVEPFLPYAFDCCHDLDVWLLMYGETREIERALRRAGVRSISLDRRAETFFLFLEWMVAVRRGETQLRAVDWYEERRRRREAPAAAAA